MYRLSRPRTYAYRATLLIAVTGASLAPTASASAAEAPPAFRPFAADSVWNQALRSDAPISPSSQRYVAHFRGQVDKSGGYLNTRSCGVPVFWAEPGTPRIAVRLDHPSYMDPALIRAWSSVPMPADAAPAKCGDRNFAVLQRGANGQVTAWEFFGAVKALDGSWSARWGGVTQNVERDRGIASGFSWSDPSAPSNARSSRFGWNVTASSISTFAGIVTQEELRRGVIEHALTIAVTDAAKGTWMWPAQRTDGGSTDPDALPEGAHLRIDPTLDLASRKMVPLVRMLAVAAQKYGFVVRDKTGGVNAFIGEEAQAGTQDAAGALLAGQYTQNAMKAFPWDALQVLDAPLCSGYAKECLATEAARLVVDRTSNGLTLDTRNSRLNHPVVAVRWDLDGDGVYESSGGTSRVRTTSWSNVGSNVGVQLTTITGAKLVASAPVAATREAPVAGSESIAAPALFASTGGFDATGLPIGPMVTDRPPGNSGGPPPGTGASAGTVVARPAAAAETPSRAHVVSASGPHAARHAFRVVKVKIACPRGPSACRGSLRVRFDDAVTKPGRVRVGRYSIAPGRTGVVVVRLADDVARRLAGPRATKRLRVVDRRAAPSGTLSVGLSSRR